MGMSEEDGRQYLYKTSCDACGSSDANAIYSDGGAHCFSCQAHVAGGDDWATNAPQHTSSPPPDLVKGEAQDLRTRRLTQETCSLWRYWIGHYNGQPVHIANYANSDRQSVAQKLRFRDKDTMPWLGKKADATPLYGQWLWPSSGRMVVVTEGEIDALSVSQAFGNKWPVVSVPSGAAGAHKDIRKAIDWLSGFDKVVFAFDMDEPGQEAAVACAKLLAPGRARIATLPKKDASEMLQAGMVRELTHALHNAREYRPDGIVTVSDIKDEALKPKPEGHPWFIPEMTKDTHGVHPGNLVTIGAGTGVGKTDFLAEQIAFQVTEAEEKVGAIFLETPPTDLLRVIGGKVVNLPLSVPGNEGTSEDLQRAIEELDNGRLCLYDSWGATDWDTVRSTITYMAAAQGCQHIYLDHLTALAALVDDEKKALEGIMAELAGLAQQRSVAIWLVSHLATPDGKPHEEGGRVTIRHFKGSRAIGFWSHIMIGLERDQQAENDWERTTTTVRILKYRPNGSAVGNTYRMSYDYTTGRLVAAATADFERLPSHEHPAQSSSDGVPDF